ncbi:MAG: type IV pilus twitching motility protein PilT [Endomicrobiaceae bacterium]|nr:type IV pilus twitching motility protein PilT [Endomicrobiaceae bacterium]
MYNLMDLLSKIADKKASDLHIVVGLPPMMRLDTVIKPLGEEKLTAEDTKKLIYSVLSERQIKKFEEKCELDASFPIADKGRVRLNVFKQRGSISAALRFIPQTTYTFEELHLSKVVYEIVNLQKGLVLVTGATGSGKTTTLASMLNYINERRRGHIITIEDPIEYLHSHKNCIVNQREIGSDTISFADALKYVLRQDPDVILIGEMRDLETIAAAITLAETGHLVFATLHTMDAASSVNRIVDVFPGSQQAQIRSQLSLTLKAVFSQQLLPHASGHGMALASEIMIVNDSIKNIIREMKTEQLYSVIQTSRQVGMQTMNQSLFDNVISGNVLPQVALEYSSRKEELIRLLQSTIR